MNNFKVLSRKMESNDVCSPDCLGCLSGFRRESQFTRSEVNESGWRAEGSWERGGLATHEMIMMLLLLCS